MSLNKTLDEVLSEYEDLWRRAALEDAKQMNVNNQATGPWRSCAWIAARYFGREDLETAARTITVPWRGRAVSLSLAMAETNNNDRWTWDMFANKFRDLLARHGRRDGAA